MTVETPNDSTSEKKTIDTATELKKILQPYEAFKPKSLSKEIEVEYTDPDTDELKTIKWTVKAISPRLMIQHAEHFEPLEGREYDEDKPVPLKEQVRMMKLLAPLIDIVLPYCCVKPKIVFNGLTDQNQVNIDDIDLEALFKIFIGIFNISGMGKKSEEYKKKLSKPQ